MTRFNKFKIQGRKYYAQSQDNANFLHGLYLSAVHVFKQSYYGKQGMEFPKIMLVETPRYDTMTINKKIIHMNFRNYTADDLIYHLIHELAHVMCDCMGHEPNEYKQILYNLAFTFFRERSMLFE